MVHGASVNDYSKAWESVSGKSSVPASALADAKPTPIRDGKKDKQDPRDRARQAVDIIRKLENFLILTCVCGLKLKVPPGFAKPEVACPNCKKPVKVDRKKKAPPPID